MYCMVQLGQANELEAKNRRRVKFPRGRVCSQEATQVCILASTHNHPAGRKTIVLQIGISQFSFIGTKGLMRDPH